MAYKTYTIKNIIEMINENKIYLPAIQRKFVWKPHQIEKLFDSIMRGYPIGTFLFWDLEENNVNKYTFYKFIQNYHERDNNKNEISPRPELRKNIIGVLDGQQRISSMYIALQGTYAYKKAYFSWNNDKAFPIRKLYLNLLGRTNNEDNEYEFKFLTIEESNCIDVNVLWFDVRKILEWGNDPEIDDYYDELIESTNDNIKIILNDKDIKKHIKKTIRILHQRIVQDYLISYFEIKEQELDKILDIFIRVNSAGTILSRSDLLFSTIIAHWQEGRDEIDKLITTLNKKGDGFKVNSDFIMRACLVLCDLPVIFKVEGFKESNIIKIKDNWDNIKDSLEKTFEIISDFGFSYENLTSNNAVIPIAYYLINGGCYDDTNKQEIKRYLIHSLVKKIYGGQSDTVISHIREALKNSQIIKNRKFNFDDLANEFELRSFKQLKITKDDLDEILNYKKGAYSFMILSLLYPQLRYGQVKFHQDHIHPDSFFTNAKLKELNLSKDEIVTWRDKKDRLPNLQLLEERDNQSKNKTEFKTWLDIVENKGVDKQKYIADNYIPLNTSYDIKNFNEFYMERRKILMQQIMNKL
ncbi:DUF262 domain-containing protein [Sarcina sp. JB2]|uniref:DUF262 domain-containing protein n=1 Tax=Candidatus Sarcina troglodytae TaxID=2726954 RepID=A0ACD1BCY1_9CLOT|nr:DUF262 domain-containing protein [Sarcina sp. JB2]QPJ85386.1 DUF262 domain-containing protein [Sarcina sp. JB2]